MSLSYC